MGEPVLDEHARRPDTGDEAVPKIPLAASGRPRTEPRREIWFRRRVRLRDALREMWRFRELVLTLAERDLRARYKQTLLGGLWAVITPLLLMLVFSFVFTRFAKIETNGVPYSLFAYMALVPWTFFSSAVLTGGMSLVSNLSIVNKVYCPREVFPTASLVVAAVDTVVASLVLGLLFAINGIAPQAEVLYAPLLIAVLVLFTLGVSLVVSVVLVYLRDLRHALPLLMQLLLFATPVAYGFDLIAHSSAKAALYAGLNPVAAVIDGLRRTILFGLAPQWIPLATATLTSLAVLSLGYKLFKRLETGIADFA